MIPFTVPPWVRDAWFNYDGLHDLSVDMIMTIRKGMQKFSSASPLVSVVIPVWNEEKNIARTLLSLSRMKTSYPAEIIIVNNNSTDRTQDILECCGVQTIIERKKGVAHARQTGLGAAKGKYLLCGDGDSLYPETWIDSMVEKLERSNAAVVWGQHSFIPDEGRSRFQLAAYETLKQTLYKVRSRRRPHLNAMGANVGYRREWALEVGGYDTSVKHGEDGRLALAMMAKGKIVAASPGTTRIWTNSRRFNDDGSLFRALSKRLRKEVPRFREYLGLA